MTSVVIIQSVARRWTANTSHCTATHGYEMFCYLSTLPYIVNFVRNIFVRMNAHVFLFCDFDIDYETIKISRYTEFDVAM